MALDPFERRPLRTSKSGGTRCTSCEWTEECAPASKCVYPLICVTMNVPSCGYSVTLLNVLPNLGAVPYDCDLKAFDLSYECGEYVIDMLLYYDLYYGVESAILVSYTLGIEVAVPFTDAVNARCPSFDFDLGNGESISVRKYELVSIGQQKCLNSGPDDCTEGRCLPRYLCADIWTVARPDEPYKTSLSWYTSDLIEIDAHACCSANLMPTVLIARVINFSPGCSCIGPARVGSQYYTAEQAAATITDPGALLHLYHGVAYPGDGFVEGEPQVPVGAHYWRSEVTKLCPAPGMVENDYTRESYGVLTIWIDTDGRWQAYFEVSGEAAYPNFYRITDGKVLCCSPFQLSLDGIIEEDHCQDTSSVSGTGILKIHVGEFQGWVGENPLSEGNRITLYSERVNTASPPQTVASDCIPKLHLQNGGDTFKDRTDRFSISTVWPDHVFDGCQFVINETIGYDNVQAIDIYPRKCTGCDPTPEIDPYGPVQTGCCPQPIPRVLYATAVQVQDCPCASGTVITLTYDDADEAWLGSGPFGSGSGCGTCTVTMRLSCADLIASVNWRLDWSLSGSGNTAWSPTIPPDVSFQCGPLLWITRSVSSPTCCNPSIPAPFFYWVISE